MKKGYTEKEMKLAANKMRLQYGLIELLIAECRKIRADELVSKNYCMYCEKKLKNHEAIILCKECTE
jgi:hypothetical protein